MKKAILALSMFCLATAAHAQVKIGNNTNVIDPSSILELEHPNKALYLTRVSLSSTSDLTTVPNPKAGMEVYNTNPSITGGCTSGVGVYYFDGTNWVSTNACGLTRSLAWLLLGNAGTNDAVNFLGTTDATPLTFRINNLRSGRIELQNTGNTSLGYQTLLLNTPNTTTGAGSFNTAMGGFCLSVNTTGGRNSAFGYDALGANTTGDSNAAFGFGALQVNTVGFNNSAFGAYSLNHNISGKFNTAVGYESMLSNISDSGSTAVGAYTLYNSNGAKYNVAMGLGTLFTNLTGSFNTSVGTSAMRFNLFGSQNTTLGMNSGYNNGVFGIGGNNNTLIGMSADSTNITGSNNTAVGHRAGYINASSNNTFLGAAADGTVGTLNWAGAIGSNAKVSTSNALTLGATDAGSTARTQSVFVGINVTNPTQRIDFRNGHLRNRQDTPPTISVTSSFGTTNAILNTGSSDVRGQIIATGNNNANGTTVIHVDFTYPCSNVPYVTITPANQPAQFNTWYVDATATGFDLYYRNAFPGSSLTLGPVFNYMIME